MTVTTLLRTNARFPELAGPHELAWSYILDLVFADAAVEGITDLGVRVPTADTLDATRVRGELVRSAGCGSRRAVAVLNGSREFPDGLDRLYLLDLAGSPRASWPADFVPVGWRLASRLFVFTRRALLWGIVIRAARMLGRPGLVDKAHLAMRRAFASTKATPSFYCLSILERE